MSLTLRNTGGSTRFRLYPASLWSGPAGKFRLRKDRAFVGGHRTPKAMKFFTIKGAFTYIAKHQ